MKTTTLPLLLSIVVIAAWFPARVDAGLGLVEEIVTEAPASSAAFQVAGGGAAAPLWLDPADFPGVRRAAADLQADVQRVTTLLPALGTAPAPPGSRPVIIGTLGKSALIDSMIASGKLDAADLTGKWESFVITTIANPLPGVEQALVIAGSDKRGTIYGIYELSEQLGVSPWYWWADVPVKPRSTAYIMPGRFSSGEPMVKYRGIFLNDEQPALTGWANARFGGLNQQFYTKVFELLLRLRGNYLWPAMWGNAFNEDDPMNPALADQYGIVMGTSHHEPMLRAQQEWSRNKARYGNATWDYVTNSAGLKSFWADGVQRNKNYESVVTIGMRGDGDTPMIVGGDMASNVALLENIVTDQRTIISQHINPDPTKVPQLWALYKEVQDYYDYGMSVPDDVTLLYCDDNWGNIRRLPTAAERARAGGSGVYYHFDYVGGPRSYKWLNTNPLPRIQEQMNLAYEYGANRIWIVNVGDLKPMEVPMEFFLRMAWNPARWQAENLDDYLLAWATREFGAAYADEAASLVAAYTKFNGRRKPELLSPSTFSLHNHREAERIRQEWRALRTRAENLHALLPAATKDAFYQLVLHPVKACSIVNDLYVTAALNNLYATQQRASTNTLKTDAEALFQADADLVTYWNNTFAGGKWNRLMDQVHIGYTTWSEPAQNTIPALQTFAAPASADLGVALEGSAAVLPAGGIGVLPALSSEGGATSRFIDVFRRGTSATNYSIQANQPWVIVTNASGTLGSDVRAEVSLDWSRVPTGSGEVMLTVQGAGGDTARTVRLPFVKAVAASASLPVGFLDPEGFIAIEAPRYDRAVSAAGVIRTSPDDSWGYFKPDVPTLADELRTVGYQTAIIGKWHLGLESPNTPNERGFDHFHGFLGDMMDSYTTHLREGINYMRLNSEMINPKGHATDIFTDWACDYLRERSTDEKPFFLYLAYNAPHFPIEPPADFLEKVRKRLPELNEKRAMNVALVEHLDDRIGKLLAAVKGAGLENNTVIVITSDNGGSLPHAQNNDPWRGGKQDHYDGGLRVPFMVRWPGHIRPDTRSDYQGLNFDLFPTFLEIAGVSAPPELDAVSLLPVLEGGTINKPRDLYFVRREGGLGYGGKSYEAIISDGWKLMQNDPYSPVELYNLKMDPQEKHNLLKTAPSKLAELAPRLRAHIRTGGATPWRKESRDSPVSDQGTTQ